MKKTLLAFAVLSALPIISSATTLNASTEDITHTSVGSAIERISASSGYSVTVKGDSIKVNNGVLANTVGKPSEPKTSAIFLGTKDTESVEINTESGNALYTNGSDLEIRGKNISVKTVEDNILRGYGEATIGGDETELVSFTGGKYGLSLLPYRDASENNVSKSDGVATITGKKVVIEGSEAGLWAQNNSTGLGEEHFAKLIINADDISITSEERGVVSMSQGDVELNGNTFISAPDAILARGDSKVNINKDGTHIVQIDGNLNFNYDKKTSGTSVNAIINLNLSGSNSYWKGNTLVSWGSGAPSDPGKLLVENVTLNLNNGAQWIPSVISESTSTESGTKYVALNNLVLDGGVVTIENVEQNVEVENLKGNGVINVATELNQDGTFNTSKLSVESGESTLSVNYTGINADQISNAEEAFKSLEGAIQTDTATVSQVQNIAEGDVSGAYTNDGGKITQAKNTKLDAFGSVAALNAVAWRHELNSVSKRMGELRDAPEGVGAWARLYGSEMEYGDQNIESQNTTIQIGSDYKIGQWTVGATVGYTDGESDYDRGSSDNEAWNFGVYGTWFAENGQYVDLIAKYSRLSQDFKLDTMKGDYDNNAFVISAEYGWHLPVMEIGFIEPQVELTYGRIMGEDFTTSNGVEIEQDDFDSFIGRLGVRAGIKCPDDWGTVYARASVVHDFDGEFDATARSLKTSATADIYEDLGGTWGEFGIGANINFTKNTYMYVDAEITSGGEVDENYRWNIGVRHNF